MTVRTSAPAAGTSTHAVGLPSVLSKSSHGITLASPRSSRPHHARRSTAVEVALKMAFKKFAVDHGIATDGAEWKRLQVVALDGGYHGDTLGVMDCSPESVFNGGQTPWYRPRGLFLEPPTLGLVRGAWQACPPSIHLESLKSHSSWCYVVDMGPMG